MRRVIGLAIALGVALAPAAHAQALGPQRQFLALEPYYEWTNFDAGQGSQREKTNGYGARLWVNLDPFHFIPHGSIALYTSYTPSQGGTNAAFDGVTALHYGAEYDQYFLRRPVAGIIDPFLSVGGGRYRISAAGEDNHSSYWTVHTGRRDPHSDSQPIRAARGCERPDDLQHALGVEWGHPDDA